MSAHSAHRIRLGVSSCLLGEEVRFDGGHKRDPLLTDAFSRFVEWVPVCPEVDIGLGIPRPSIKLVGDPDAPRLIEPKSGRDLTETMRAYAEARARELEALDLHGYVLKAKSPSCGMERVPVSRNGGHPHKRGRGIFAAALMARLPLLPAEEEGRLHDMRLRENFVERIFAYKRWRDLATSSPRPKEIVRFHSQHKLTLLSHSRPHYSRLGRLVAQAGTLERRELVDEYGTVFMDGLRRQATTRKHTDVLFHLLGFLKKALAPDDKAELVETIERYRQELVPLIVPLTLLKHYFRKHPVDWVLEQTYLDPYPEELMLRNHV